MVCRLLLLVLLISLLGATTVKYGGELYIDGQNARNIGMGGYSASFSDGRNPALLINAHEPSVHFSHKNKFAGLARVSSFSYLHHRSINGKEPPFYFSIINRSINNIPDTRAAWIDAGENLTKITYDNINEISQNEVGLKIACLRKYKKFALGVSIKPIFTSLAEYTAWGLSGDIAAIVPLLDNRIEFNFRIEDIFSINRWNTGTVETNMPLMMAGGQIQVASLLLGIEAGSRLEDNFKLNYHTGFEFHQEGQMVVIRGGASHNNLFCVGIGLNINVIHVDYAYTHPNVGSPFEPSHIFSIGMLLNKFNAIKGKITP